MPGPPPLQKATVKKLARQEESKRRSDSTVDQRILDRIQKCLQRAKHPNTPELEAKAAWRMSSRLMAQYNVTQADLLAETTINNDFASFGGESVVAIVNDRDYDRDVINQAWVSDIAKAMTIFFDCAEYSVSDYDAIEWTFYGIAANTVAAAMAFEMAHNLTLEWARNKKGVKHSYCLGIGDGLVEMARQEKRAERKQADENEKQRRCIQSNDVDDPMADWPTTFAAENEQPLDLDADFEDQLRQMTRPSKRSHQSKNGDRQTTTSSEAQNSSPSSSAMTVWKSSQALVQFRQSAQKVADEYLKATHPDIGFRKESGSHKVRDFAAYHEGKRDSKSIDVKRRRIGN